MSNNNPVFSQIVGNARVGRGPVIASDGSPISGSHRGVDLAVAISTPITPATDGKVVYAGYREDYGNVVVVQHDLPNGRVVYSLYAHMAELPSVTKNQVVSSETTLGLSGSTGRSTGPHVHFEIVERQRGQPGPVNKNEELSGYFSYQLLDPKANPYGLLTWDPSKIDREDLTKFERVAQLRLNDNEFESYKTQLASIETKGKGLEESYQTVSTKDSHVFLGRYQMDTKSGLIEAGYMDKAGNWTEYARTQGISSERDFLNSPGAQDDALRRLSDKNAEFIVRNDLDTYIGDAIGGKLVTGAGLLLGAHNSRGNLDDYIKSQGEMNGVDGNKFGISNYVALGDKVQPDQSASAVSGPLPAPSGHWEDTTQYDQQGNVIASGGRVWVSDLPAVVTTDPATSTRTPPAAFDPVPNRDFTRHEDGSVTLSFIAKADSADGSVKKGDLVTEVFRPDGHLGYYSVRHTELGTTTLAEIVPGASEGEAASTYSKWVGSTLQLQGQWDLAGNLVGDRYTVDGIKYIRGIGANGQVQWLDPNGLNASDRIQQSYDQETRRLFNAHSREDESGLVSVRILSAEKLRALETGLAQADTARAGTNNADAKGHPGGAAVSDDGSGAEPPLNVIDLPVPDLVSHFTGAQNPGVYGAGQIAGFDVLPFNENSSFLVNADGDIVAEINRLPNGYYQLKDLGGSAVYISANDGSVLTQDTYAQAQAKELDAANAAQASQAASALGLMNSIIGLQHWDNMSDLQRTAALVSIYNVVDKFTGDKALPGDLGTAASALGLLNALDKGDIGSIAYSGLSLVENLTSTAGVANSGWVSLNMPGGANFLPGLSFALALSSGDPVSIASSGMALMSSLGMIGPWGMAAAAVISVFGSMFGDDEPDIPTREGLAHAQWDAAGNTLVITDQDIEGGGPTATGWMTSLVDGLQAQLAGMQDANGNPYALVPGLLPAVGFRYDPDGLNLGNGARGFVYLQWNDENGQTQTRYYDGAGNRGDGTGEALAGDFMQHAAGAIAPAWQVETVLAHYQQGQGIHLPNAEASLPRELADGLHQTLQALTLALPVEPALQNALIDIDGDGYLERTQWLATNQQVLGVDANGDGLIGTDELLSLNGPAALNSLNWLDANGDHILNAKDPAFTALRLWMDVNADADSSGETRTLAQAGIVAVDFSSNPPAIVRADGSRTSLTAQTLTGYVLGVQYQAVVGGVLQLDEQLTGSAAATLHAVNTREFDGRAGHIHSGDAVAGGDTSGESTVDAGDNRLVTTTANTVATQTAQTSTALAAGDTRVRTGVAGAVLAGQAAAQTPGVAQVSSNGIVFVPAGAASPGAQMRDATQAMVRSAESDSLVPLMALALGAAATQWPTVATAATPPQVSDAAGASTPPATAAAIDWQIWDGTRFSPAPGSSASQAPDSVPLALNGLSGQAGAQAEESASSSSAQALSPSAGNPQVQGASSGPSSAGNPDDDALPEDGASPMMHTSDVVLDFPQTHGEQGNSREDTGLRFLETLLLANDSTVNAPAFPDRPSLRISSVFAPVHGSVSLQVNAQGAIEVVFLPEANYHGPASFDYTVTDQYGLSNNARVNLSIAAVNDAPVTQGETASGDEDNALLFTAASLMANDTDVDTAVDGDVLRITRVGLAQHGQVFLQPDGTVRFEPDANYNGPAQFSYWVGDRDPAGIAAGTGYETQATVNLTVLAVNDLPVVTGEVMASDEDIVLNINPALLLANDADVDTATTNAEPAQVLSITAVGNAQHGSIALLPDGTLQFTPELNYFGAAGFSYTVDDGHGGQVQGQVVVNLAPVNDAPDVLGETVTFNEDEVQTLTQAHLLANDSDVDNPHSDLRIVSVENATHGTVALNPDGTIRFAPDADYFGPAQFTYTVSDGAGGFTVGLASLDIAPVNDAPRLLGEALTLAEDTAARFSVAALLANDADVDNLHTDLTITGAGNASHGSVHIVAGEIVFTPDLNYNGTASFTYTVSDGAGGTSEATVNLTFNPVNDAPVANSELVWGKRDVSYTLTQAALLANDTDVESPTALRVSSISNVQHGTAVLNADGSVRFTPDAGYTGRGSFEYVVQDPEGLGTTATAQIDFSRVNVNPTATDDGFVGYEDIPFSITQAQLLVNDSDADNTSTDLRVIAVGSASNGTVSLQADGSVRFVPTADFNGTASFSYLVADGDGGQTWATAQLNVQSVNDAPVIDDIIYGRPVYGYLPGSDSTQDVAIYDEAQALALANIGSLYSRTFRMNVGDQEGYSATIYDYAQLTTPTYYRNGHMRPVFVETQDATYQDPNNYDKWMYPGNGTRPVDDPYRQNGYIVAYDPDGNSGNISFSIASGPQHGHAWANQYTNLSTPRDYDHTMAPTYAVGQTGAWQYYSQRGDPYSGADTFTIAVTDGGGATSYITINTSQVGSIAPVALDLDGNGLQYTGLNNSQASFDVDHSGISQHLAWVAPSDALLARDIGGDGQINQIDEISFVGYLAGAKTDLEGLAAFDSNGNHMLDAGDDRWKEFGAWQDKNGNGISDAGEFKSLDDIGITQIGLQSDQQVRQTAQGVIELGQSRMTWADGHTGAVGDVVFAVGGSAPVPAATSAPATEATTAIVANGPSIGEALPAHADTRTEAQIAQDVSDAQLMRMALLFNQMVNTAEPEAHAPLGFVPIAPETQWHDIALMAEQHSQLQASGC